MITVTPFLADAAHAKLEEWGPLDEALPISGGEPMQTSGTTLRAGEGDQEAGVRECTPRAVLWSLESNEFVHILSGRMTVTPDGGEPTDIGRATPRYSLAAGPGRGRSTTLSESCTFCSRRCFLDGGSCVPG